MNQSRKRTSAPPATTPDSAAASRDGTRATLLDAARTLFVSKGFDGASVRAITERAGANLGAVTYHFGSKEALYHAVLEEELTPLADGVVAAAGGDGPAADRMAAVVRAYFEHFRGHPDLPRLMLQEIAAGKEPPPVVAASLRRVLGALVRLHEDGLRDGTVRPGNPVLTALSVVAQPIYMSLVAPLLKAFAGVDLGADETRAEAVEHATAFVRAGLAAEPVAPSPPEEETP